MKRTLKRILLGIATATALSTTPSMVQQSQAQYVAIDVLQGLKQAGDTLKHTTKFALFASGRENVYGHEMRGTRFLSSAFQQLESGTLHAYVIGDRDPANKHLGRGFQYDTDTWVLPTSHDGHVFSRSFSASLQHEELFENGESLQKLRYVRFFYSADQKGYLLGIGAHERISSQTENEYVSKTRSRPVFNFRITHPSFAHGSQLIAGVARIPDGSYIAGIEESRVLRSQVAYSLAAYRTKNGFSGGAILKKGELTDRMRQYLLRELIDPTDQLDQLSLFENILDEQRGTLVDVVGSWGAQVTYKRQEETEELRVQGAVQGSFFNPSSLVGASFEVTLMNRKYLASSVSLSLSEDSAVVSFGMKTGNSLLDSNIQYQTTGFFRFRYGINDLFKKYN